MDRASEDAPVDGDGGAGPSVRASPGEKGEGASEEIGELHAIIGTPSRGPRQVCCIPWGMVFTIRGYDPSMHRLPSLVAGALGVLALVLLGTGSACGGTSTTSSSDDAGADSASAMDASANMDASATIDASPDSIAPVGPATLLFAGDGPTLFKDTWEWSGVNWTQRTVTGPEGRFHHAMATLGGKIVLFGGNNLAKDLDDTWEWDGATWTQKMVTGPTARHGHTMATLGNKIVLYGGSAGSDVGDTWEWDGTAWTNKMVTGPGNRYGHAMAATSSKIVLFGGVGKFADTWEWDGAAWAKSTFAIASSPSERAFSSMATLGGKAVMFGGEHDANNILSDTWEWDGAAWTQRTMMIGPSPRYHHGMTTFQGKIVLFGGSPPSGSPIAWLGDTWQWDGAGWTKASMAGPSGRLTYTLAAR